MLTHVSSRQNFSPIGHKIIQFHTNINILVDSTGLETREYIIDNTVNKHSL